MARPQRSPPPPCHDTTLPPRRTLSSVCHKVVRHVPLRHAHDDFSPPNSQNPDAPRSNSCSQANPLHQTWVPAHPYQLTTRQEFPSESSTGDSFPFSISLQNPKVAGQSIHKHCIIYQMHAISKNIQMLGYSALPPAFCPHR